MHTSKEKGITRNRYAKFQPTTNRINGLQCQHFVHNVSSNRAEQPNEVPIDSRTCKLQSDHVDLVLATSKEKGKMKKQIPLQLLHSPSVQPFCPPAITSETARKQKQHKHRIKDKRCDSKTERLAILNFFLYVTWWPMVFCVKLCLIIVSIPVSFVYNGVQWSILQVARKSCKRLLPQEMSSSVTTNQNKNESTPDLHMSVPKTTRDFNFGSNYMSAREGKCDQSYQAQTKEGDRSKDFQCLMKNFNLSLKMMDAMRTDNRMPTSSHLEGHNYFKYCLHHQDISSVELSSDGTPEKYSCQYIDDKGINNKRKRTNKQYRDSCCHGAKKSSLSTIKNYTLKGSKPMLDKKHRSESRISPRISELTLLKNLYAHLSDSSQYLEKKLGETDNQTRFCGTDKQQLRNKTKDKIKGHLRDSAAFTINFKNKVPHLLFQSSLQKKLSSKDDGICEKSIDTCDHDSPIAIASNVEKSDSHISNSQCVAQSDKQITKEVKVHLENQANLPPKTVADIGGIIHSTSSNPMNSQKLKMPFEEPGIPQRIGDSDELKNKDTVFGLLENADKQTEITELGNIKVQKNASQTDEFWNFKEKAAHSTKSRESLANAAKFTKPIDAKTKWLEMKKKIYGRDYANPKMQIEKLGAQSLTQITPSSKLPAHKIFQYNMLMGRARQVGTEQLPAESVVSGTKCTTRHPNCLTDNSSLRLTEVNPQMNRNQSSLSKISTSLCLSQTQSLSKWPLAEGASAKVQKRRMRNEEKLTCSTTGREIKAPAMTRRTALYPHQTSSLVNSSMSSSNVMTKSKKYVENLLCDLREV